MSEFIGTFNKTFPSSFLVYDFSIPTFTVSATSAGKHFGITGSQVSVPINAIRNSAAIAGKDNLFNFIYVQAACFVTTNTTDATELDIAYSVNGGSTWTAGPGVALTNGNINKSAITGTGFTAVNPTMPVTSPVLFRAEVFDNTDPTTDALTITNVRVSAIIGIGA